MPDGERLEGEPRLVDLAEIGDRQLGDAGATMRDVLDEPDRVEPAERLSDRHRAHVEPLGQLLDEQTLPGDESARRG